MATASWSCTVCGYVHLGDSPPDFCPICGVGRENFVLAAAAPPVEEKSTPGKWRCLVCDYIHEGNAPPGACPVCGAGPEQFEGVEMDERSIEPRDMTGAIVIIGGGIAGLSAAEAARKSAPGASVTMISRERDLPYYRLNLTRYLAGEISGNDLTLHPESWYAEHDITLLLETEVTAIDPAGKMLQFKTRPALHYDKLILAMGAHPTVPPIPGASRENVATLRTLRDAERILTQCTSGTKCVIVGGGVLGLETAAALAQCTAHVTLVEGFEWLLPRQLNRPAGERLARKARELGIDLICGGRIKQFDGDDQVKSVVLESGQILPADLVLITAGVRSNSYLARMAGLEVNQGVVVDQHLLTSDPDIFAAGDLAEHQGTAYGTWAPSLYQGTIAGMNAAGGNAIFAGIPRSNTLKVIGVDMFSIGQVHPDDAGYQVFESNDTTYDFFVFRDARLIGAILLGDTSIAPNLKKLIEEKTSCAALLSAATDAGGIREGIAIK